MNQYRFSEKCLCVCSSDFTSVNSRLQRGWQLDAVVDPLTISNPSTLTALNSLLNQEAEDITWILRASAVPLPVQWSVKSREYLTAALCFNIIKYETLILNKGVITRSNVVV